MKKKPRSLRAMFDRTTLIQGIAAYFILIFIFGLLFFALSTVPGHGLATSNGERINDAFSSLYFSFISVTSAGYGDIVPQGASRILAMMEIFVGLLLFGVIISKFVSVKQETILEEVYDISFDEKINRLRSALYLYRTDSNRFLEKVMSSTMTQREIDDLWTHFTSLGVTLTDIVKTIRDNAKEHTKRLDPFMLELLLNSVDLSLNKTYRLVSLLIEKGHKWKTPLAVQHLENIMHSAGRIIAHGGHKDIPNSAHAKLEEMQKIVGSLRAVMEGRAQPLGHKRLQDFGTKKTGR